jgi:hypothetical protein
MAIFRGAVAPETSEAGMPPGVRRRAGREWIGRRADFDEGPLPQARRGDTMIAEDRHYSEPIEMTGYRSLRVEANLPAGVNAGPDGVAIRMRDFTVAGGECESVPCAWVLLLGGVLIVSTLSGCSVVSEPHVHSASSLGCVIARSMCLQDAKGQGRGWLAPRNIGEGLELSIGSSSVGPKRVELSQKPFYSTLTLWGPQVGVGGAEMYVMCGGNKAVLHWKVGDDGPELGIGSTGAIRCIDLGKN